MGGPNLYLVGFMGTGKTTLGQGVAQSLNMPFIDLDTYIESKTGTTIADIFKQHGELAFRELESKAIKEELPKLGHIIACGGGIVTIPSMLDFLKDQGLVICLEASPETIFERTKDTKDRPLLNEFNALGCITQLLSKRSHLYSEISISLNTDGKSVTCAVNDLVDLYKEFIHPVET